MSPRLLVLPVLALAALAAPSSALAGTAGPLTISPANGTPDASPKTGVSVLGAPPADIASVTVSGSLSGAHPGKLLPFSGSRGAVFQPDTPLTEGERADVVVSVRGRKAVRLSFEVARLAPTPPFLNTTAIQPDKLHSFVSEPGITPPKITVLKQSPSFKTSVFLTPLPSPIVHPGSTQTISISPVGPGGPLIVDGRGDVVWFKQIAR